MDTKKEAYQKELKTFVDAYIQSFLKDIGLEGIIIPTKYHLHSNREALISSKYNPKDGITIAYQMGQHPANNLFSGIHEATHAIQYFLINTGFNMNNCYNVDNDTFKEIVCDYFRADPSSVSIDHHAFEQFLSENNINADYVQLLDFDLKHYPVYWDFQTYSLSISEIMANDVALKYAFSVITDPEHIVGRYKNATVLDKEGYSYFGVLSSFHEKQRLIYEKAETLTDEQRIKNQIECSAHPFLWKRKINEFLSLPWDTYRGVVAKAEKNLRDLKDKYYHSEIISTEYRDFLIKEDEKALEREKVYVRECIQAMKIPEMFESPNTSLTFKISNEHGVIPSIAQLQEDFVVLGVNVEKREIYYTSNAEKSTPLSPNQKDREENTSSGRDLESGLELDERS